MHRPGCGGFFMGLACSSFKLVIIDQLDGVGDRQLVRTLASNPSKTPMPEADYHVL